MRLHSISLASFLLTLCTSSVLAGTTTNQVAPITPPNEPSPASTQATDSCAPLLDHTFRRLASDTTEKLCDTYRGKVLLVVNTASKCGFTSQYEQLETLYDELKDQGFAVLGFPSNDFAGQEPGTEKEIESFCRLTYSVKFPMFQKSSVKGGEGTSAFYHGLAKEAGTYPAWNFHKYLIGRDGNLISMFPTQMKPKDPEMLNAINKALSVN